MQVCTLGGQTRRVVISQRGNHPPDALTIPMVWHHHHREGQTGRVAALRYRPLSLSLYVSCTELKIVIIEDDQSVTFSGARTLRNRFASSVIPYLLESMKMSRITRGENRTRQILPLRGAITAATACYFAYIPASGARYAENTENLSRRTF